MAVIHQVLVEILHVVERSLQERNLGGTQSTTILPDATAAQQTSATAANPAPSSTMSNNSANGPTSSPLLFFVALGFGVVFTNLWYAIVINQLQLIDRSQTCTGSS